MSRTSKISPLFFLLILIQSIQGQTIQEPAWLTVGAYAKLANVTPPKGRIVLPNGTRLVIENLTSPSILQWKVIDIIGNVAQINVTFSVNCNAIKVESDETLSSIKVEYEKALVIDVSLDTGNGFADGEPMGRLSLWAETNVKQGQRVKLFSSPSDTMEGTVTRLSQVNLMGRQVFSYELEVLRIDPFAIANYVFDQKTGIALVYTLLGPTEIIPNSTHTFTFPNGTTYHISSYARTRLAEKLGLENTYALTLDETNVGLGENRQSPNSLIYFGLFLGLFVFLTACFIHVHRNRRGGRHH